ncbi:MAG: DsbA family protein [Burkholderiales bacterium]
MNRAVLVGLIVAIVIAVGAGGWIYYKGQGIGASLPNAELDASEPAPAVPVVAEGDKVLGKADAPVTIVEYFSLGCPHCRNFHETILPKLKAEYIDTGKARLVFRDFPLDGVSLAAATLTRCVNDLAYFAMVDTLFQQQDTWHVQDGIGQVASIAKGAGMDEAAFNACISDPARRDPVVASAQEATDKLKVNSTPTFFINDRVLKGVPEYEAFKATVDGALARAQ